MNVFLGEPSDTVISYVDKRYYKHTVDAMNTDVSACYKVCEEKSAVIPAEKTSSNLSATIKSIQVGYTGGDLAVPVTGNITGVDSCGYSVGGIVYGSIRNGVCGNICGGVCGNICGGVCGNICGGVGGTICGDIVNGVSGSIYGSDMVVSGNVCGNINGNVYGTVYGTVYGVCGVEGEIGYGQYNEVVVCGNINGTIGGNIGGDVLGSVNYGVCGNVCCGVYGDVGGRICGWFKPENVTTSTVLTLDQNSDNNALLKIDVCGKQYYIHAN